MGSPFPKVSVVMAVHNERPYLEAAVQSVLDQTFEDFEFIIVNDGSGDGSKELLGRFSRADDRIRLVHQENRGLPTSLNRGLDMAHGKYVARMDGDDVSHPERFERQVRFLDANPQIGILGTQIEKIDSEGRVRWKWSPPAHPDVIAWRLLFDTCFCHPTIMARRSLMEELGGYAEWAEVGQDYELWTRAVFKTRLANLPEKLYKARRHGDSATLKNRREQIETWSRAAATLHRAILGNSTDDRMASFLLWMETGEVEKAVEETNIGDLSRAHSYIRSLYQQCARKWFQGDSNIQALRHALRILDNIANYMIKIEGISKGFLKKLQSFTIVPVGDILPLFWSLILTRLRRVSDDWVENKR